MRGGTGRDGIRGDVKGTSASHDGDAGTHRTTRRGARARFDKLSHAGRRSPVREALRLPDEPLADEQLIPHERSSPGGAAPPIPTDAARSGLRRAVEASAPQAGRRHCPNDAAASGCRGALAGTGPLTKWPPSPSETPSRLERTTRSADRRLSELDPWAEDEAVFGQREIDHALSPTPGTPPHGHLAIEPPPGWRTAPPEGARTKRSNRRRGAGSAALRRGDPAESAGLPRPAPAAHDGLAGLREPIRIEIELEHCGRWTCGLAEKASLRGLEVSLGHRGVGTRDFLSAGRRVRLLVSARRERPFQLRTRILWVDPPSGPGRAVHAQLAVDTTDPAALARWQTLIERLHV